MAWGTLSDNQWVSFTDIQGGGFVLKPGQSATTNDKWITKSEATTKYYLNENNPYIIGKASNQWISKIDLTPLGECGGSTYDYYYNDFIKFSPSAGKVSYTIGGLYASEVVNVMYNSNIIHVAQANGSGIATGVFYFPYDGSNQFVTFDSTSTH